MTINHQQPGTAAAVMDDYPHSITQHPHPKIHRGGEPLGPAGPTPSGHAAAIVGPSRSVSSCNDAASSTDAEHLPLSGGGTGSSMVEEGNGDDGPIPRPVPSGDLESQTMTTITTPTTTGTTTAPGADVSVSLPAYDPYGLSSAYKTDQDLARIRHNMLRKRIATPPRLLSDSRRARRVKGFYRAQNAAIERMLKTVEEHRDEARQELGDSQLRFQVAVWGSLAANVLLSGLQLYAAVSSGSLSLYTTMADAVFDPLSNLTLIVSSRAVRRVDPSRFPAGKSRLETCGNILFCFLMTSVSMIIIAFSVRDLSSGHGREKNPFHLPSVIAVCAAFGTKLGLFFYCWAIKDRYSQVRILWQDHRNDLFINGLGIMTSVAGSELEWWIDPAGAIVLSVAVTVIWIRTACSEFMLLVGVVAPAEAVQLITYTCVTHSDAIIGIDTVRVYHSGPRLIAEVDIVMEKHCTLAESHAVAESLQMKIESLPDVERSFVHVDYETSHSSEHSFEKDI